MTLYHLIRQHYTKSWVTRNPKCISYSTIQDHSSSLKWLPKVKLDPQIVYNDDSLLVAYKPPGLHTIPLLRDNESQQQTLFSWLNSHLPCFAEQARQLPDGGFLHRLDASTGGLVLVAKNHQVYDHLRDVQHRPLGLLYSKHAFPSHVSPNIGVVKTYIAFSRIETPCNHPSHIANTWDKKIAQSSSIWHQQLLELNKNPRPSEYQHRLQITSQFRSYGPKGSRVKILFDTDDDHSIPSDKTVNHSKYYTSDIEFLDRPYENILVSRITLSRGFRHQVRSHLAYLGCPLVGDELYSNILVPDTTKPPNVDIKKPIGLYAVGIQLVHPTLQKCLQMTLDEPKLAKYLAI